MIVKIIRRILSIVHEFNTILEVEDMSFMFGQSLKLHLLRLEMFEVATQFEVAFVAA
jgi:hypothetical protein